MIEFLPWDSNFFGIKIGKIRITSASAEILNNISSLKHHEGYGLLYLFFDDKPELSAKMWLSANNAFFADAKITYQKIVGKVIYNECDGVRPTSSATDKIIELAIESGHKSRFKKDDRLNHKFTDLYLEWIKKSVSREIADEVLTIETNGEVTGFVSLKKQNNLGKIGLIAVDSNHRGKGFGKLLLKASENWYIQNQVSACEVVTQLDNIQACNLYESFGYTVKDIEYIYHY